MIWIPNGCQNGANFDAKTHKKSMPKQVTKKIVDIIKNHVFLMCKNMRIHFKTLVFEDCAGGCANTRVITNHRHVYQIYFNIG